MNDKEEYRRLKSTTEQRRGLAKLMRTPVMLRDGLIELTPKLNGYKYLKRDVGQIAGACTRLLNAASAEFDPDVVKHTFIQQASRDLAFLPPDRKRVPQECVVVQFNDLLLMCGNIIDNQCKICMKTGNEVKHCAARSLLKKYVYEPDSDDECTFRCGTLDYHHLKPL